MVDRYNNGRIGARGCGLGGQRGFERRSDSQTCHGQNDSQYSKLITKLQRIEFSMIETGLYLDAYPNSRAAMNYYKKLNEQRKDILEQIKSGYGVGITIFDSADEEKWQWVDKPWPWELGANREA